MLSDGAVQAEFLSAQRARRKARIEAAALAIAGASFNPPVLAIEHLAWAEDIVAKAEALVRAIDEVCK